MTSKAFGLAQLGNVFDDGALSNRNMIINGAMQVAQRGTSFSGFTANTYTVDRWQILTAGSTFNAEQRSLSSHPDGLPYSLRLTLASTTAPQLYHIRQRFEGITTAHLGYGTSAAKASTVSFWVKSNVVATFGFALIQHDTIQRGSYHTYTIAQADVWQKVTAVVPADTAGETKLVNNMIMSLDFYGGGTSGGSTPDGSWGARNIAINADGALANSGDYLEITGVQLEVGDTATPFEHRSYGDELARCQRYYFSSDEADSLIIGLGDVTSGTTNYFTILHPTTMRTGPTITLSNESHSRFDGITVFRNYASRWGGYDVATATGRGYFQFEYVADAEL